MINGKLAEQFVGQELRASRELNSGPYFLPVHYNKESAA